MGTTRTVDRGGRPRHCRGEEKQTVFRTLSGADRAMLYKVAYATGLRCGELAGLTEASLMLEDTTPAIVVEAAHSKRGERDVQPIPTWLAGELRIWLRTRPTPAIVSRRPRRLWPGSWDGRGAEMLRIDLEAAEILYRDEAGHVFDFHSLRHQFATGLAKSGVHPKKAQELARHSDINLTMNTYTHLSAVDLVETVEAIPNPSELLAQYRQRATGTDGRGINGRGSVAPPVARPESEKSGAKTAQRQSEQRVSRNHDSACWRNRKTIDSDALGDALEQKKPLQMQRLL